MQNQVGKDDVFMIDLLICERRTLYSSITPATGTAATACQWQWPWQRHDALWMRRQARQHPSELGNGGGQVWAPIDEDDIRDISNAPADELAEEKSCET